MWRERERERVGVGVWGRVGAYSVGVPGGDDIETVSLLNMVVCYINIRKSCGIEIVGRYSYPIIIENVKVMPLR